MGTPVECILPRSLARSCVMVMVISEIACRPQEEEEEGEAQPDSSFLFPGRQEVNSKALLKSQQKSQQTFQQSF